MSDEDTGYESDGYVSEKSWHCGCPYDPWPGQIFSEDEEEKETPYENAKRKGAESRAHMKRDKHSGACKKKERRRRDKIELVRGAIDTHTSESIPTEMTSKPGDFSFVKGASVREMFDDAYKAITVAMAWEFVERDPGDGGFMFSSDPYSVAIGNAMKYEGHSGSSYGWTMRVMQQIARGGWDRFVAEYKEPQT